MPTVHAMRRRRSHKRVTWPPRTQKSIIAGRGCSGSPCHTWSSQRGWQSRTHTHTRSPSWAACTATRGSQHVPPKQTSTAWCKKTTVGNTYTCMSTDTLPPDAPSLFSQRRRAVGMCIRGGLEVRSAAEKAAAQLCCMQRSLTHSSSAHCTHAWARCPHERGTQEMYGRHPWV